MYGNRSSTDRERIYRSELVKANKHPVWKKSEIHLELCCGNHLEDEILFEIFTVCETSSYSSAGHIKTSVRELLSRKAKCGNADIKDAYFLVHNELCQKKDGSRIVVVEAAVVTNNAFVYTLDDYINSGYHICTSVAIDFSSNNSKYNFSTIPFLLSLNGLTLFIIVKYIHSRWSTLYRSSRANREVPELSDERVLQSISFGKNFILGFNTLQGFPVFGFGVVQNDNGEKNDFLDNFILLYTDVKTMKTNLVLF